MENWNDGMVRKELLQVKKKTGLRRTEDCEKIRNNGILEGWGIREKGKIGFLNEC
jgi:hypothetical protein